MILIKPKLNRRVIKIEKVTENSIQNVLWLELQSKQILVTPNVTLYGWESDLIGVTNSGFSHEYEIKITKSDFKLDAKKYKHRFLKKGIKCPNYFWYVCPENMVRVEDVPEYAGLIYIVPNKSGSKRITGYGTTCRPGEIYAIVKQAPRLHAVKISDKNKEYLSRGLMLRYWSSRVKE